METTNIHISRSQLDTLLGCETAHYWNYLHDGKGIISQDVNGDTSFGIYYHEEMEEVVRLGDQYTYVERLDLSKEENFLLGGLTQSFRDYILPELVKSYDILFSEKEYSIPVPHAPYVLDFRADNIVRNKETGRLELLDYKTAKTLNYAKESKYGFTLQTALYTWCVEQLFDEPCDGINYIVAEKGILRWDKGLEETIRYSPFTSGFQSSYGVFQTKWAKGWNRIRPWDHFSLDKWYADVVTLENKLEAFKILPIQLLDSAISKEMRENVLEQLGVTLQKVEVNKVLDRNYLKLNKNFLNCYKYGDDYRCPYYSLCFENGNPKDYLERTPHH